MSQELTASQEDLVCEPQKKCDFCKMSYPKDEITIQQIDAGEKVEICVGCLEDLEDNNNADYKEQYGEDSGDEQYERERDEKGIAELERGK